MSKSTIKNTVAQSVIEQIKNAVESDAPLSKSTVLAHPLTQIIYCDPRINLSRVRDMDELIVTIKDETSVTELHIMDNNPDKNERLPYMGTNVYAITMDANGFERTDLDRDTASDLTVIWDVVDLLVPMI